ARRTGTHTPPWDEKMNNRLVLPALDFNNGCVNIGTERGTYDIISGFRSMHIGGCFFLFCDGSVRFVTESVPPPTYPPPSTIAGDHVLVEDYSPTPTPFPHAKPPHALIFSL